MGPSALIALVATLVGSSPASPPRTVPTVALTPSARPEDPLQAFRADGPVFDPTWTASAAPALPSEPSKPLEAEEPLSADEIALIESLAATAATATAAEATVPRFDVGAELSPLVPPVVRLPASRLRASGARTLAEAFESQATVIDGVRRYLSGDSALLRGQSGHRIALTLDGIPLHHALSPARETPGWSTLDPGLLEEIALERPGSLELAPRGLAGAFRLMALRPRARPGFEAEVEASARSADRSTGVRATTSAAHEVAAVRIGIAHGAFGGLRVATSSGSAEVPGDYQRWALSARGRLLGRPEDLFSIQAGFDLDRLEGVPRSDLTTSPGVLDSNQRLLAFARADLRAERFDAELLLARQTFRRSSGAGDDPRDGAEEAISYFGRAALEWRAIEALLLRVGATAERSDAEASTPAGRGALGFTELLELFASGELRVERVTAAATVAFVDGGTELEGGASPTARAQRVLGQIAGRLTVFGPLGLRAGVSQSLYLPSVRDLRDAAAGVLAPERAWSVEAGPSLFGAFGGLDLIAFHSVIDDAIEPESLTSNTLVSVEQILIEGLELSAALFPHRDLRFRAALTWAEGREARSGAPTVVFPTLTSRLSARWSAPTRGAFLEAHARSSSNPVRVFATRGASTSLAGLEPRAFFVLGLAGGLDLGLGFSLTAAVENVLDAPGRAPMSLVPNAGVDVRASLAWAWF